MVTDVARAIDDRAVSSPAPDVEPCRVRVLLPAPVAVRAPENIRLRAGLLIVAPPVVPARLITRSSFRRSRVEQGAGGGRSAHVDGAVGDTVRRPNIADGRPSPL